MKNIFLFLLVSISISAQKNINDYKYVIVPKQFESFNKIDKYQVNSLVKFLLKKNNFTVFFNDEQLPEDLARNKCLALTASLKDNSGMFTTKTQLSLKDCFNNILFTSKEGTSKIKEYKKAYHEAIRRSFQSVKTLNYKYQPTTTTETNQTTVHSAAINTEEKIKKEVISGKEVSKDFYAKRTIVRKKENFETLYAQANNGGFQLVDKEPKVVFKILKTQYPHLFIIKDKNGMLVKKENGFWEAQYYDKDKLLIKNYEVKF